MLLRQSRIQLMVFGVLALIAMTTVSVSYVGLPRLLGFRQMTLHARFADVSGLYPSARVTYRGVDVGVVKSLEPTRTSVTVTMQIDKGSDVPSDAIAAIHSTSAIGEQYVDLVPARQGGPYLTDGSTIPESHTVGMPQAGDVLDSVKGLIDSIPPTGLSKLLDNITTAFGGGSNDLQTLVSQSDSLLRTAQANIDPTTDLIHTAAPFLNTQVQLRNQELRSVGNLAGVTTTLADKNADLITLLKSGAPFADRFTSLVGDLEPSLPVLLTNLTTSSQALVAYLPGAEQALALLPASIAGYQGALLPYSAQGGVALDFKLQANYPATCTKGFIPTKDWRDPRITTEVATPPDIYCKLPKDSKSVIRGARNYPCEDFPGYREATVDECAIAATGRPEADPKVAYLPGQKPLDEALYEPATGRFIGPDGKFYALGSGSLGTPPSTWQQLVLSTMGK
jgi:virulence factor Mce-like protein